MKSTRLRVGHFCRVLSPILVLTIAANGCAVGVKGVEQAELARLRAQEVVVVHYTPASFFVRKTTPQGVVVAPLILLPLVMGVAAAQNSAQQAEERAAGAELLNEVSLDDPIVGLKQRLLSRLAGGAEISRLRPVPDALDSDDLKNLKQAFGSTATVLDLKTTGWGLHFHAADPKTFVTLYSVKARLVRLDQEKVLWRAEVGCFDAGDRQFGIPTLDDLKANGGALLKTSIAKAAEHCVEPLLARFRGEELTPPTSGPDAADDVTLAPATLAQAEATLFGSAGLVEGSRRFKAKFQGLTLTTQDLPRLRTMMKQATASPWRSEVQFRGTLDGVPFKAEMEKGSVGRSEFTFEGLRFDDKEQASAFLAPLQGRGVREVKLVGVAGGRPIKLVMTPTSASTNPSPSMPAVADKVDDAGPARGLVEKPAPNPSSATTAPPRLGPSVSHPVDPSAVATPPPGALTALAPSRPSAAPGDLKWPPAGSSYVMSERMSGSYGSGRRQYTVRYIGEQTWHGKTVFAFSDGSVTTYVDAQHRTLGRIKDGAVIESFDPYFIMGDWPLAVGKRWPNRHRHYEQRSGRFKDVEYGGKVEASEDVRTSAGTFKAFRIVFGNQSSNLVVWYSHELGLFVKTRAERFGNHALGSGVRETELVSYDFKR